MSAVILPSGWPSNMSADDRKVWLHEQITKWVGEKRIEECLSAFELGNLSMTEKAVAYRSLLIVGSIKHCRIHEKAEVRIPILTLITFLSDNAKGTCFLTISRMQGLFGRSRQCIVDNILALEEDGLIGVARTGGMTNCYWPRIPTALVEMSPNPVWVIDALATMPKARIFGNVDEVIAAATERDANQSSGPTQSRRVDQSSRVDQYRSTELDHHRSSGVDPTGQLQQTNQSSPTREPVKSSTDSISSLNLFSSSQGAQPENVGATQSAPKSPLAGRIQKQSDVLAMLNPEAAARKAFAASQVAISATGKVTIGAELRADLRKDFTEDQIERGLEKAARYMEGGPDKRMASVRTACGWAKEDDRKQSAAGKLQSTRRTFAR